MSLTTKGLLAMMGIWLTMALMPIAELLQITPAFALVLRGGSGVVILGIATLAQPGIISKPSRQTLQLVLYFAIAAGSLFQAITAWGATFAALFLDLAVLVPLWFVWHRNKTLPVATIVTLVLAIVGTMMALRVQTGGHFEWSGLIWSTVALIANGLFIETAGRRDVIPQNNATKAFWMSLGLVMLGVSLLPFSSQLIGDTLTVGTMLLLLVFSIGSGALNFYCTFVALRYLSAVTVGMLVLGVTP